MARKKETKGPTQDMARKIWLAGIGAYGRAFSEAQESLAKMGGETSKMFEDLVEKGEEIEDTVETHGRELASRVKPAAATLDDRIKKMRARLMAAADIDDVAISDHRGTETSAIEDRLTAIEAKLDLLLEQSADKPAPRKRTVKKTAKKATRKKSTTKKSS